MYYKNSNFKSYFVNKSRNFQIFKYNSYKESFLGGVKVENEENFGIKDFLDVVKRRKIIIVISFLISIILAVLLSFYFIKPNYTVSTSIIVGKTNEASIDQAGYNNILLYQNLLKTYSEIIMSNTVSKKASEKLSGEFTEKQILRLIKVIPKDNTQILVLTAQGPSAEKALDLLNAVSESFIEQASRVYPSVSVDILDKAELSSSTNSRSKGLIFLVVFFIEIMLLTGSVFLIEYFDLSIKNDSDIEKYIGLKVIGIIPKYKQNKNF